MRKARRDINFDDILSSNFAYSPATSLLDPVLKGHLILEAILVEIIQIDQRDDTPWRWSFPKKVAYLVERGRISEDIGRAFLMINDLRNDFAHIFDHSMSNEDLLTLARKIEDLGVDFSDSIGHYTVQQAEEFYGDSSSILSEILWCVLFEAAIILHDCGGREIFAD